MTRPPAPPSLIVAYIQHFQRRVLEDALLEGTAMYWRNRAASFTRVGTPECDLIATNCRRHAELLEDTGLDADATGLIDTLLAERQEVA